MDLDVYLPAIVTRDVHAFGQWTTWADRPLREGIRSFATRVDVEAVLQETLLRVWQVAPRFVPDGKPNGLLRLGVRMARNLAVSELRRLRATEPLADDDLERASSGEAREPEVPDPMLRRVLSGCHDELPEQPRRALDARLSGEGGAEDTELAAALGMRVNTFLQNFTRARRMLADCLEKHGIAVEMGLRT
jgi:DNA-directed RNA polymerase specialized sigma24 family protein